MADGIQSDAPDDLEANRKNVKMYVSESFSPEEFLNLIKQSESTQQCLTLMGVVKIDRQ